MKGKNGEEEITRVESKDISKKLKGKYRENEQEEEEKMATKHEAWKKKHMRERHMLE